MQKIFLILTLFAQFLLNAHLYNLPSSSTGTFLVSRILRTVLTAHTTVIMVSFVNNTVALVVF